jgi:hypothetical protein
LEPDIDGRFKDQLETESTKVGLKWLWKHMETWSFSEGGQSDHFTVILPWRILGDMVAVPNHRSQRTSQT